MGLMRMPSVKEIDRKIIAEGRIIGTDLEDELKNRAFAAYFRNGGTHQPGRASGVEKHRGKYYVILRNVRGVLACYRVRNDGKLKGLVRIPTAAQRADHRGDRPRHVGVPMARSARPAPAV